MLVDERWLQAERPPDRLHAQALQMAVEAGAVSWLMLQKKLHLSAQGGVNLLKWLRAQGFVDASEDINAFQTTLITEEEHAAYCAAHKLSTKTKRGRAVTVNDALYKACLRLFIKQEKVNLHLLIDTFAISNTKARKVLERMKEEGFIRLALGHYEFALTKEECEEVLQKGYEI